jgi:calcium-dependent protein kinase
LLGSGGFGDVFLVKTKATGQLRAAKKIPRSKIKNYERFMNEIIALKECDHPNIVKLYEVFEDVDNVFLIQEYLAGGELFQYIIQKDHLSEKEAADIFSQMIRALIYCHKKNFTHRDLKPENFLFKSKEEGSSLKLIDFGYARKFQKQIAGNRGLKFLRMCSRVGTENYIAPEIIQKNYSSSCDVW